MSARCDQCRYWKWSASLTRGGAGKPKAWGDCRRHAPRGPFVSTADTYPFPPTSGDDWCGEFQGRPCPEDPDYETAKRNGDA